MLQVTITLEKPRLEIGVVKEKSLYLQTKLQHLQILYVLTISVNLELESLPLRQRNLEIGRLDSNDGH